MATAQRETRRQQRDRLREERRERERAEVAARTRRRRLRNLSIAVAAASLTVTALVAISQSGAGGSEERSPQAASLQTEVRGIYAGIPQDGATLGDPKAPVTLVEFADMQCPWCAEFDRTVLPEVIDRYVRPGLVRIEYRPLRFLGPDSVTAAAAVAAAAQQNRLFEFVDAFFRKQGQENSGYVTDEFLRDVAAVVPEIDADRLMNDRGTAAANKLPVRAENEAQAAGIDSTPSFLAGPTGERLQPLPLESLDPAGFSAQLELLRAAR